jgi:hypothetical protein
MGRDIAIARGRLERGCPLSDACTTIDLAQNRIFLGMWALSVALIAGQFLWPEGKICLAPTLLASWGVFCSLNAIRCGRVHCRVTGPLCLLGAITLVLMSRGVVPLSGGAFNAIFFSGVAGAFALEAALGKYGRRA